MPGNPQMRTFSQTTLTIRTDKRTDGRTDGQTDKNRQTIVFKPSAYALRRGLMNAQARSAEPSPLHAYIEYGSLCILYTVHIQDRSGVS